MSVRIRLSRTGTKKKPLYRIVAADQRMKRDGRFLEKLGTYDPATKGITLDKESVQKWLSVGASPSDKVNKILIQSGFDLKATFIAKKKAQD